MSRFIWIPDPLCPVLILVLRFRLCTSIHQILENIKCIKGIFNHHAPNKECALYSCFPSNTNWMKPIFNMLRAAKLFMVLDNSIEYIQVVNRCAMFEIAIPNNETVGKTVIFIVYLTPSFYGRDWCSTDWVRTQQTYLKRVGLRANLLWT